MYWQSDNRFHSLIAEHCDNPFLESAYHSLGGQIQRFRLFSKLGDTGARYAAAEHRAVYEALQARDPERAATLMREHITKASERILPRLIHDGVQFLSWSYGRGSRRE